MSGPVFRGLTLIRPWPASIALGPKRVENRTWRPGDFPPGSVLALHAGLRWDQGDALFIRSLWDEVSLDPREHPAGVIVALAEVTRYERANELFPASPWHFGPWCWELGRVLPLGKGVPSRGAQGLWVLDPAVEEVLRGAWEDALEREALQA